MYWKVTPDAHFGLTGPHQWCEECRDVKYIDKLLIVKYIDRLNFIVVIILFGVIRGQQRLYSFRLLSYQRSELCRDRFLGSSHEQNEKKLTKLKY